MNDVFEKLIDVCVKLAKMVKRLLIENERLKTELEAAIADIKESNVLYKCEHCAHTIRGADCDKCEEADFDCEKCDAECKCKRCRNGSNWEWRGVKED